MKKMVKTIALTAFFVFGITTMSTAQMSKNEVSVFIKNHPANTVEKFGIVNESSLLGTDNKVYLSKAGNEFIVKTIVMTAMDNSLHIKDGTGKEMYIPYSQIKGLSFQPSSESKYSRISIFM